METSRRIGRSLRGILTRFFLEAKKLGKASDKRRVAIFLAVAGPEARELSNTFTFADGEETRFPLL